MTMRTFIRLYTFALVSFASVTAFSQTSPNIVFYIADDHGRNDSSVYGNAEVRTPMMDSLARDGMLFNNAFVVSPACGPSRSALLTGLMPARSGAEHNHEAPRKGTLVMIRKMRDAGYEVAGFGKIAHGTYANSLNYDFFSKKPTDLATQVREYLKARTSEKPLCLIVGDRRPHAPWTTENLYDPDKLTLPARYIDTPETRSHWARYLSDVTGVDSEMRQIDSLAKAHFGGDDFLFVYSSDHGNAWPFGKWNLYDWGCRTSLIMRWPGKIEPGIKSDAIVSWMDLFPTFLDLAGSKVPEGIDGKPFTEVLRGKSETHRDIIFTAHSGDGTMNVYPIRAVNDMRFKYLRNIHPDSYHTTHSDRVRRDGHGAFWDEWEAKAKTDPKAAAIINKYHRRPAVEFYDLETDPEETNNLAESPDHEEQVAKMSALLDDWMRSQGDEVRMQHEPFPQSGPIPGMAVKKKKKGKGGGKAGGKAKK